MVLNVARYLTHYVQVRDVHTTVGSYPMTGIIPNTTTVSTVACYVYGSRRRFLTEQGVEVKPDFSIVFAPGSSIIVNQLYTAAIDQFGENVWPSGETYRAIHVDIARHTAQGKKTIEVFVEKN